MLYEGLGLARTLRDSGSCVCVSEDAMWIVMPSHSLVQCGSGWNAEKCANTGLTARSPLPKEWIPHLSTLDSAGILAACIHAYIYRQFNVILTSTLLFSIKKSNTQSKEKVLCCALKGKSHLIPMLCVRGEMSFSILSNEAARLCFCERGVSVEKWWF